MTVLKTILSRYDGRARDSLLPLLWEVLTEFGTISPETVHEISHTLHVPEAEIFGVISFYSLFSDRSTAETVIRICTDPACGLAGGDQLYADACSRSRGAQIEHTTCLGLCDHAPAALVSRQKQGEIAYAPVLDVNSLVDGSMAAYQSTTGRNPLVLLATGNTPEYQAGRHALFEMSPEEVIQVVKDSGLIGRGGAAFPTGVKWTSARAAAGGPPLVICNADESEPGTFKDRVLLEQHPHLLLEGMILCAYAVGSKQGYLFIRGEYPEAQRRVEVAIAEARQAGLLGENILGSSVSFDIEVRRGAGAYICGEETALFEAIEGKRGFPRIKPPYPTTHGLFGRPTVINNVETLCAVPGIVEHGAAWFRAWGTEKSPGTKLVSVSGHIRQPGVYEIEPGITLNDFLNSYCGGIEGTLQAVLMGGAAGTFLKPSELHVRLTFENLRAIGGTFGIWCNHGF